MKNFILLFLLLFFSFNRVEAVCNDEELNEWATKVEVLFTETKDLKAEDIEFAYFLGVTDYREDITIKVKDVDGQIQEGKMHKYVIKEPNEVIDDKGEKGYLGVKEIEKEIYGVGCYNNLEEELYVVEIYGNSKSKCNKELLKTIDYKVPRYNRMIKYAYCEDYPEHELCKSYTNKTKNMSEQEFKKILKEYDKEQKDKLKEQLTLIEKILIYALYIIVPFVIITVIYMVKISNLKKEKRDF